MRTENLSGLACNSGGTQKKKSSTHAEKKKKKKKKESSHSGSSLKTNYFLEESTTSSSSTSPSLSLSFKSRAIVKRSRRESRKKKARTFKLGHKDIKLRPIMERGIPPKP